MQDGGKPMAGCHRRAARQKRPTSIICRTASRGTQTQRKAGDTHQLIGNQSGPKAEQKTPRYAAKIIGVMAKAIKNIVINC